MTVSYDAMNYDTYDDRQLVACIINNDSKVIEYFFKEKCLKIFSYVLLSIFDGRIDRRELVNELFLYLAHDDWRKIRSFDFRSRLTTWLSVVAVRYFRKKRACLIENDTSWVLNGKTYEIQSLNVSAERNMDIRSALYRMPNTRYRRVIEELDLKDVRPEQLAEEMNVTVDNLYNIHRRALIQLRCVMGRKEDYYG